MMVLRHRGGNVLARLLMSLVLCSLVACGGNTRAPVEDREARSTPSAPVVASSSQANSRYRVQVGDTLYSIAFRYGLDYRKVAAANNIPGPYTIYPGQKIVLKEGAPPAVIPVRAPAPPPTKVVAAGSSKTTPVKKPVSKPAAQTVPPGPSVKAPAAGTYAGKKVSSWRWPTTGRVSRGYSRSVHKGIDISGQRGDAVVAVASGKVVYAGTGIVGFGELLIIKHNEVYLSAYGHNDRLLVSEGQVVKAGQKIAEKGSSGTDTVKLHFEIRKEGKPIDPQRLLPRR